ncbi:MAG: peroxiredoxin family protein [Planctomycetes bacterium]|nr:peroxiredoxin family protein [Planctomycetota bacterium]
MRPLCVTGLLAAVTVLAGCHSSSDTSAAKSPWPPPTREQLKANADRFQNDPKSNTTAERVPLKFLDVSGKEVDLATYHDRSNVVLVVVKGLPKFPGGAFCPGCLAQLNSLTANYEQFKKRNAEVVMVFPGSKDALPKFLADGQVDGTDGNPKVEFPLLSDEHLSAVKALGITGDLARPATYILDKKGNVVFAYVAGADTTYDRPSVKALLDQLDKLNATK